MAELHIIGQLVGAKDYPAASLFCRWSAVAGGAWERLQGEATGQTQVDNPNDGEMAKWAHPIDLHYATKGIQGWPKLHFQVWHQDGYGRSELYGYGFCHVPTSPGEHRIECVTWRPTGNLAEQARSYFVGGGAQVLSLDVVHTASERSFLRTQAMGTVILELGIITRNFEKFGVEM